MSEIVDGLNEALGMERERAAVVAWLRANSQDDDNETMILRWAADAISRGDHLLPSPPREEG